MTDVFPRRNLPEEAEQWGRAHDDRVVSLEQQVEILGQSLSGQNRNAASSIETLADQVRAVKEAQTAIQAQQASIVATQTFLSTQTVFDSRTTQVSYTGNPGGTVWFPHDGTYDCSLLVTTGAAGRLLMQLSTNVTAVGLTTLAAIDIVSVLSPDFPGAYSTYVTNASAGVSRISVANLSPNTTYTVRTRRGASGSASGTCFWGYPTLTVTRS